MPTNVIIGYADGTPLESAAAVSLLINGQAVETQNPDANGLLSYATTIPVAASASLQFNPDPRE